MPSNFTRTARRAFGTVTLALIFVGGAETVLPAADKPVRVKLATLAPRGTSFHQTLQEMGEKWRQAPEGGVALTIYTDGTQGTEADMVRKMRVGQIQAAMLMAYGLSEIEPSVTALQNMPMMFRSLDELDYVRKKVQPMMEKRFLDKGFVVLFWGDAGWVRFFSKHPGLHPDDFKKMKVFVSAGDSTEIDLMKATGFHPVPLEYTDTLTGLDTGMIDAVPTIPIYALTGQFYGPTPNMLEINWAPLFGGTVIRKDTWEAIPPATREVLFKAAQEAGERIRSRSRAESNEAVEAMKKRGLKVHSMPPAVEAEWRKAAEEVYPRIRGTMVPADLFDEVVRLVREYRASQGKVRP